MPGVSPSRIELLKERLANVPTRKERLLVLLELGEELMRVAPAEAKAVLEEAIGVAGEERNLEVIAQAGRMLADVCRTLGDISGSTNYSEQVLELARQTGNRRLEGSGFYLLGMVQEAKGDFQIAQECYTRAMEVWREIGYEKGVYATLNQLGNIAGIEGRFERAIECYQECTRILTSEEFDRFSRAINYCNLGWMLMEVGRWEEAAENFYRTIAIAEEEKLDFIRWNAVNLMGELFLKRDRVDRAVELFSAVVDAGRRGEAQGEVLRDGLTNLGEAQFRQHNLAAAAQVYNEALELCEKASDRLGMVTLLVRMAELALAQGELNRCEGLCSRALALAQGLGVKKAEEEVLLVRALLETERGMTAAADDAFEKALQLLVDASNSYEFARVQFQYGRFLVKSGRRDAGVNLLKKSAKIFRNLALVAEDEEVNRLLFSLELDVDREMAVLGAIARLATIGLEPMKFLSEAMQTLRAGFGYRGLALVVDNEPVLIEGDIDLQAVRSGVVAQGYEIRSSLESDKEKGQWFIRTFGEECVRLSNSVQETIIAIIAPYVQRLRVVNVALIAPGEEIANLRFTGVVGRSPAMRRSLEILARSANSNLPVLIRGESGTGKELVARALHNSGPRRDHPFIAINCAAVPEGLLEAEFFGVEKGAATGVVARKGKFELANGGTVFLDEIGDMSPGLQAKLLRVLQEKELERIGGNRPIKVDIRLVAATNQNLEKLIAEGKFRQDLYYRLNGVEIVLPPLRERKEDILDFVRYFIQLFNQETNRQIKGVSEKVMECFLAYDWPGNVRQLQNVIQRAVVLAEDDEIELKDLPAELQVFAQSLKKEVKGGLRSTRREAQIRAAAEVERAALLECLKRAGGNVSQAAKLAGYSRAQFYRLLKKHNINPQR